MKDMTLCVKVLENMWKRTLRIWNHTNNVVLWKRWF